MDDFSGYVTPQDHNTAFWDRVKAFQATLPHDAGLYSQTAPYQPHPVAASTNAMRDWLMPHILPYLLNYGLYQMQEPRQSFGADIVPANEFAKITPRR
jgi:hypothetical protein